MRPGGEAPPQSGCSPLHPFAPPPRRSTPARLRHGAFPRDLRRPASPSASSRCRWPWPSRSPPASSPSPAWSPRSSRAADLGARRLAVQIGGPAGAFIVIVYGIVERYGVANLLISTASPACCCSPGRLSGSARWCAPAGDDRGRLHQRHRAADPAVALRDLLGLSIAQAAGRLVRAAKRVAAAPGQLQRLCLRIGSVLRRADCSCGRGCSRARCPCRPQLVRHAPPYASPRACRARSSRW